MHLLFSLYITVKIFTSLLIIGGKYMDAGIMVPLIIAVMVVSIVTIDTIHKTILKKEQIKADAMIRAEEIKAKNQLEIEKLFKQENTQNNSHFDESEDRRTIREHRNV